MPTSQCLFSDADLCAIMTDCQKMRLIPLFLRAREEHFVKTFDQTMDNAVLNYCIPTRSIGNKIRQVFVVVNSAQQQEYELPRIQPENRLNNQYFWGNYNFQQRRTGYYFENNFLVLTGKPKTGDTLRIKYFRRPSRIVPVDQAGKIVSIDTGANTVTLDNVPTAWTTDTLLDAYQFLNPFDSVAEDFQPTSIGGFVVGLPASVISELSVGDYINCAGETVTPQFPVEAHQILVQYALVKILDALGDTAGMQRALNDLDDMENNILVMIDNRDDGNPQKVVSVRNLWNTTSYDFRW